MTPPRKRKEHDHEQDNHHLRNRSTKLGRARTGASRAAASERRGEDAQVQHDCGEGAFDSKRTACRTEARTECRPATSGYANVTMRVVREDKP